MNVDFFTTTWKQGGSPAKATIRHEKEISMIRFTDPDGHTIQLFGPPDAAEAFEKMAALFNEAHKVRAVGEAA